MKMKYVIWFFIIYLALEAKGQSPDFQAKALLYFQDSEFNTSSLITKKIKKSGADIAGAFTFPLKYGQIFSEQPISNSYLAGQRMVAIRHDRKLAYVVENKASASKAEFGLDSLERGNYISVLNINNPERLKPEYKFPVNENPTAIALDARDNYLAVSSSGEIQVYELDALGKPIRLLSKIAHLEPGVISDIVWSPDNEYLAYINQENQEFGLVKAVRSGSDIIRLELFGETVKFEGSPYCGFFSPDGAYFYVLDKGDNSKGMQGSVFMLKLNYNPEIKHVFLTRVSVPANPSGMTLHPSGEMILVSNSENSDNENFFGRSSLSLISTKAGNLNLLSQFPLSGALPSAAKFDASGQNFAISFFQSSDFGKPVGQISFYKLIGGQNPRIEKQNQEVNVGVGVHHLDVLR